VQGVDNQRFWRKSDSGHGLAQPCPMHSLHCRALGPLAALGIRLAVQRRAPCPAIVPVVIPWRGAGEGGKEMGDAERYGRCAGANAPGIGSVSTAGHGGIKLDRAHNAAMPGYMRRDGGWYEEDCEWALPFVIFGGEMIAAGTLDGGQLTRAWDTFRHWFPDAFERHTGMEIPAGQSYVKDDRLFHEANKDRMIVISAAGDWQEGCPQGMVLCTATRGGSRAPGAYAARVAYLVPAEEYETRSRYGFVIDEARHKLAG